MLPDTNRNNEIHKQFTISISAQAHYMFILICSLSFTDISEISFSEADSNNVVCYLHTYIHRHLRTALF